MDRSEPNYSQRNHETEAQSISHYNQAYFHSSNNYNSSLQDSSSMFYHQKSLLMYPTNHNFRPTRTSTGSSSPDSSSQSLISPGATQEPSTNQQINAASSNLDQPPKENVSSTNFPIYNFKKQIISNSKLMNSDSVGDISVSSNLDEDDSLPLKKRRQVPVEHKDSQYWEKRKKNNESAKRSRENRKSKEEHISLRVIYLEQENLQLRTECSLLRNEVEKLRASIYQNHKHV